MIIDLGIIDYREAYRIQKDLVARRKDGKIGDALILAEHPPVFTIGRLGKIENLIEAGEVDVLRVDRGGDITFHGPGQIVLYPIVGLKDLGIDLHEYMRSLETAAIRFLRRYSVSAERMPGATGVWVSGGKIASIGIAATNWITYHGMSVNINVDLKYFSMINPCGMKGGVVTSLGRAIGGRVDLAQAKRRLIDSFSGIVDFREVRRGSVEYEPAMA